MEIWDDFPSSNERVDIPIFLCSSALTKIKLHTHFIFLGFHSFVRVGTQHKYKIWNKVQNLIHFFNEKWNACVSPSKRVIFISELVQKVPFNAFFSIMHSNRHEPLLVFTLHQLHCWDFKFCLWTKLALGWSLSYFNTIFVFFLQLISQVKKNSEKIGPMHGWKSPLWKIKTQVVLLRIMKSYVEIIWTEFYW